ncbi:alpha-D-ribose 1-methylphosphonate 5-triphosphate synthase subunit PhnG [Neorhizobium sp. 2083]|uniref:phosphonate C-P lyase system protein PhnG n=1 Tax=Neorhizobium sp. 2083 TaxID=2817762 RepID=UPI002856DBBA|nr:phosphonate C-P lyase system protein PhnG [Neorhizobium sp. 2083]MDR6817525.1 alpha-D-ribose 1-methylphosphonate 5-triphosphate synthase subunit PhnG [Neorhizobium sp. 2083]
MTDVATGEPVIGAYALGTYTHVQALDILAASRPEPIKACAESVLTDLGGVSVITNRTGLAMLPFMDTVRNTAFHLGEVLIAEAHIRVPDRNVEGYGAVTGRDLEHAMAMAVIDAAIAASHQTGPILQLLDTERLHQEETDRERLKKVEATRVQMETF